MVAVCGWMQRGDGRGDDGSGFDSSARVTQCEKNAQWARLSSGNGCCEATTTRLGIVDWWLGWDGDVGELMQSRIELNALHVVLQEERKGIVEELDWTSQARAQTMHHQVIHLRVLCLADWLSATQGSNHGTGDP